MASSRETQSRIDDDDEVDFMSDDFLEQCTKNDIRPGLLFKSSEKRKHEELKRKEELKGKRMTQKQMEDVNRTAGLNKEIGADNKGFKMLEKMGFKPGGSLGKRAGSSGALKDPIPIEIKRGRGCLGRKTIVEEKQRKWESLGDVDSFRQRLQTSSAAAQTNSDLAKAQRICQTLDEKTDRTTPKEIWYWPSPPKVKEAEGEEFHDSEEEDDDEDVLLPEPKDQLVVIVNYLRVNYFYCIWCGSTFDDAEDLEQSCPGQTRDDH